MDSLLWVDQTYVQKHKTEDPHNLRALYHQNLEKYPNHEPKMEGKEKTPLKQAVIIYVTKQSRKAGISLAVLGLSYVPYIGRFVLPAASFYTFRGAVGIQPAGAIFAASLLFPRRYLISFLQAYFSSRTLMRELVCHALHNSFKSRNSRPCSSSLTSHVFATTKTRRSFGSRTVLVYSSGSAWGSTSLSRSHLSVFSFTDWQRLQQHISSPRSLTHRLRPPMLRLSSKSLSAGRTNTSFSPCHGTRWIHSTSRCTSQSISQKCAKPPERLSASLNHFLTRLSIVPMFGNYKRQGTAHLSFAQNSQEVAPA